MSHSKHTPGPWDVEDPMGADVGLWIVQSGLETYQWSCIAMVTCDDDEVRKPDVRFIDEDEQRANARLIAAAPKLKGALAAMLDYWGGYECPEVDAAIAVMQEIGEDRWSMQAQMDAAKAGAP